MPLPTAAAALALLTAAAAPFDLPPLPSPDEGTLALWRWLRTVNAGLSIPDAGFRWMFGGISVPILLLLEAVGVRKDWKLYPFLVPFWLIFGSVALGVVGGIAATAAHLVLFPVGRVWFTLRDRRRARDVAPRVPAREVRASAPGPAHPAPAAPPPLAPPRQLRDVLRAALEALRAATEERRGAPPPAAVRGPRAPATWGDVVSALGAAIDSAARAANDPSRGRPAGGAPPRPPPIAPERPSQATGAAPGKPDLSAFRPDLSRFRRRPPKG